MTKELKSVNNKRDELDCAINKLRKKPDDLEMQVGFHFIERLYGDFQYSKSVMFSGPQY